MSHQSKNYEVYKSILLQRAGDHSALGQCLKILKTNHSASHQHLEILKTNQHSITIMRHE